MNIFILGLILIGGYFFMTSEIGKNIISSVGIQTQNVSDFATNLVVKFESFSATAYRDVAGFLTIGYGHKIEPGENVPAQISETDAQQLLSLDMQTARDAVNRLVIVPLTDNQAAALISLVFNIGAKAFSGSTLLSKLNQGDYQGAANEFDKWTHADGTIVNGLIARREQEKTLFLT